MQDTPKPSRSGGSKRPAARRGHSAAAPSARADRKRTESAAARGSRAKSGKRAAPARKQPRCALQSHCTLDQVAALHAELLELLPVSEPVVIDASAVELIDSAGLQVLAAFVTSRSAAGRDVVWQQPEGVLADAASAVGLEGLMNLTDSRG